MDSENDDDGKEKRKDKEKTEKRDKAKGIKQSKVSVVKVHGTEEPRPSSLRQKMKKKIAFWVEQQRAQEQPEGPEPEPDDEARSQRQ